MVEWRTDCNVLVEHLEWSTEKEKDQKERRRQLPSQSVQVIRSAERKGTEQAARNYWEWRMHLYEAIVVIISLIERYLSQANHRAVGRSSPSSIIVWPIILIRSSFYPIELDSEAVFWAQVDNSFSWGAQNTLHQGKSRRASRKVSVAAKCQAEIALQLPAPQEQANPAMN